MANRADRRRSGRSAAPGTRETARTEPEVRRWPHPIPRAADLTGEDTAAHFILCALRYQNELLGEIKVLLQTLADRSGGEGGSGGESGSGAAP